jgi:flagellar biosynthetic protein FliR
MSPETLAADPFAWVAHYALVMLRLVGVFLFLPIFGAEVLPIRIRLGVASVLTLALMPFAPRLEVPLAEPLTWVLVGARELSVGVGLGLAAHALFAGIETAAGIVAGQSGFALASMVDPTSGDQGLAPTLFQNLLAIALLLAADLHHVFLRAVVASYELLPPAASLPFLGGLDQTVSHLGVRLFAVAVELAAPALIVTLAVDIVLGLVGRAMPQVPIMLVGYPLKMVAGLAAMALLAQTTGAALGWIGRTLSADAALVLSTLRGS